jgi:hypothetical protein
VADAEGRGHQFVQTAVVGPDGLPGMAAGQLVATYDRREWRDEPASITTCALFDAAQRDALIDRRMRFVTPCRFELMRPAAEPDGFVAYDAWRRSIGATIARVPLDGVVHVLAAPGAALRAEDGLASFAWDLARADASGSRVRAGRDGRSLTDYLAWGEPVVAPAAGTVLEVFDDADDAPPCVPASASATATACEKARTGPGNRIAIGVPGTKLRWELQHLQRGSIAQTGLHVGAVVNAGTPVGRIGNSGASREPHVRIGLTWYDEEAHRFWSVPVEFAAVHLTPDLRTAAKRLPDARPAAGTWISSQPF